MCEMSKRIAMLRKEKGLTQEEFGKLLGLQKSAIAKYENGRVENIKRSTISQMAEILECSPAYLLGYSSARDGTNEREAVLFVEELTAKYGSIDNVKRMLAYLDKLLELKQ